MEPRPELVGATRRQFLNRSALALFGLGASGFGAAAVAFLWPRATGGSSYPAGGFGAEVDAGALDRVLETIRETRGPLYVSEGRFYVVEGGSDVLALFQRCTHLGCRVPFCASSGWFECGCHAGWFNGVGDARGGPVPRGMDRFPVEVRDGRIIVDTARPQHGAPRVASDEEPAGPHCVG